jgi:hypothetical protein
VLVLVNGPLGFSLPSALTQVAKGAYRVVSDPRAQQTAAVVGQEYAPDTTAQIQQTARSLSQKINVARMILNPATGQMVPMQQMMSAPQMQPTQDPSADASGGGGSMPVQHSNMLVYAGIGVGALLLILLLRK